jgi:hypothetical protein
MGAILAAIRNGDVGMFVVLRKEAELVDNEIFRGTFIKGKSRSELAVVKGPMIIKTYSNIPLEAKHGWARIAEQTPILGLPSRKNRILRTCLRS